MGGHRWLRLGDGLGTLVTLFAGLLAIHVLSPPPRHLSGWAEAALGVGLVGTFLLGTIVHELGHVLAVRLTGQKVTAIHILGPPDRFTYHVGSLQVGVGLRPRGRTEYAAEDESAAQAIGIAVAGPAADLALAPLLLLLPVAHWAVVYLAVVVAATGVGNLIPAKTEDGRLSDGARVLQARAGARVASVIREVLAAPDWSHGRDAAQALISGWVLDVPEAEDWLKRLPADRDALLRFYAQEWVLPRHPEHEYLNIVHALSWKLVAKPDVPAELADRAATRVEWVLRHRQDGDKELRPRPLDVQHTLAVVRLRQGRPGEVRHLCADVLAATLDADDGATALATVAIAAHQRLLFASARKYLSEALALDPAADLVAEAVAILSDSAVIGAAAPPVPAID